MQLAHCACVNSRACGCGDQKPASHVTSSVAARAKIRYFAIFVVRVMKSSKSKMMTDSFEEILCRSEVACAFYSTAQAIDY